MRRDESQATTRLHALVLLTTLLTLGHHVDHVVRGNHSGWPFQDHLSPFTFSLLVYPVVAFGLYLARKGRAGPSFWAVVWGAMTLVAAAVHLPLSDEAETPGAIIDPYASPAVGWFWFLWLLATVAAALTTTVYAVRLDRERRRASAEAR